MIKSYKNIPEQLGGYTALTQEKLDEYQEILAAQDIAREQDQETISHAIGGIWAIALYEHYLDIIIGNGDDIEGAYGLIDREFMKREYDYDMTAEEFDAWVEEQQEWFIESRNLPAEPSTFPCLMNWLEDFFTNELLLPDSLLNQEAQEKALLEYPDHDFEAMKQGMLLHLQWIREKLVPAVMPPSWKEEDTPAVYKAIAGGMKRDFH